MYQVEKIKMSELSLVPVCKTNIYLKEEEEINHETCFYSLNQ